MLPRRVQGIVYELTSYSFPHQSIHRFHFRFMSLALHDTLPMVCCARVMQSRHGQMKTSDPTFRTDGDGDSDGERDHPDALGTPLLTLRERVNVLYFSLFSRRTNLALVALSVVLLGLSLFASKSVTSSAAYHLAEGAMTVLFVAEVSMRWTATKHAVFASMWSLAEASLCVACVVAFGWATFAHHSNREEHVVIVLLRLVAQGGRAGSLYLKHRHLSRADPVHIHTGVAASAV